ncbi:MAG: molybdopterin-guanine dinucleotide biosynthesis protein B [Candidatus Caldarchaeales archaeon]
MWVIAVFGFKMAGKTRLASMIVSALRSMGYRVAAVKHVHHADFTIEREGSDSWRLYQSGADPVIVSSPRETAVIHRSLSIRGIEDLKGLAGDVDFVVVEGFQSVMPQDSEGVVRIRVLSREGEEAGPSDIPVSFASNPAARYVLPDEFGELLSEVLRAVRGGSR